MTPPSAERMRLRDRHLEEVVRELFVHDDRLRGIDLDVRFDGGVAHLSGEVDSRERVEMVRELVGRLDGVMAVWDRVRVAGREPVAVDLGCGETKQYPDNIGVDRRFTEAVDVVVELTDELPFAEGSIDTIFAVHVLEHLVDFLPLIGECHRILRPGGVLHVLAPWWRYVNAVADPTHVRLLDVQTIKGICLKPPTGRRWHPLHAACDGATVFADLTPLDGARPTPDRQHMARFFD